jgi:ribonucleotide monophosphatase NagD (HAD superfamily)
LEKLGAEPGADFIMIGDDIENDIYAAGEIGGRGILVYTGKTKFPLKPDLKKPSYEASDLAEATYILKDIYRN